MAAVVDYQGVALIITAVGSLLTTAVAAYLAVRTSLIATTLDKTHKLVNGMSHELQDADKKAAYAEGQAAGVAAERQQPMVPSDRGGPR
jgi:hypothetical protein